MGTRGLEIVRFRGRYYIRWHQYDSYFEGLGASIVSGIPTHPKRYQAWLKSMRAHYAAMERDLERNVYEIRDDSKPDDCVQFNEFTELPTEIPRLSHYWDAECFYITNLDHEVFTINHSIHFKLDSIPRQDDLWRRAISESIYLGKPTISPDLCPEEHMASLALELPEPNREIGYKSRLVTPRTNIQETQEVFLTHVLARTLVVYKDEIVRFGREWSPDSFPFRELAFALVSIASGQAKYHSPPAQTKCQARRESPGWLGEEWVGDLAPLLEFGSMSHRPGESPGVSPPETMYWLEGVLVSLVLVVDGEALTQAVTRGIKQGHTNFQIVILSLFEAAFAEVSVGDDGEPFVEASDPIHLSPLRPEYCLSTHPRERPVMTPEMNWQFQTQRGERIMQSNCTGTARKLSREFPGLAALVHVFDAAASRRAASKSAGIFPLELYDRILDFVDYDTWKTCLVVSTAFRSYCLRKYRLDDWKRIVAGPFVRLRSDRDGSLLSFDFEDMQTGKIRLVMQIYSRWHPTERCKWMPLIGGDRKALMLHVGVHFEPAEGWPEVYSTDEEPE